MSSIKNTNVPTSSIFAPAPSSSTMEPKDASSSVDQPAVDGAPAKKKKGPRKRKSKSKKNKKGKDGDDEQDEDTDAEGAEEIVAVDGEADGDDGAGWEDVGDAEFNAAKPDIGSMLRGLAAKKTDVTLYTSTSAGIGSEGVAFGAEDVKIAPLPIIKAVAKKDIEEIEQPLVKTFPATEVLQLIVNAAAPAQAILPTTATPTQLTEPVVKEQAITTIGQPAFEEQGKKAKEVAQLAVPPFVKPFNLPQQFNPPLVEGNIQTTTQPLIKPATNSNPKTKNTKKPATSNIDFSVKSNITGPFSFGSTPPSSGFTFSTDVQAPSFKTPLFNPHTSSLNSFVPPVDIKTEALVVQNQALVAVIQPEMQQIQHIQHVQHQMQQNIQQDLDLVKPEVEEMQQQMEMGKSKFEQMDQQLQLVKPEMQQIQQQFQLFKPEIQQMQDIQRMQHNLQELMHQQLEQVKPEIKQMQEIQAMQCQLQQLTQQQMQQVQQQIAIPAPLCIKHERFDEVVIHALDGIAAASMTLCDRINGLSVKCQDHNNAVIAEQKLQTQILNECKVHMLSVPQCNESIENVEERVEVLISMVEKLAAQAIDESLAAFKDSILLHIQDTQNLVTKTHEALEMVTEEIELEDEEEYEEDDEDDTFMQVLWPQGNGNWNFKEKKKDVVRSAGLARGSELLQKAVVKAASGGGGLSLKNSGSEGECFNKGIASVGRGGGGGGGWCVVM